MQEQQREQQRVREGNRGWIPCNALEAEGASSAWSVPHTEHAEHKHDTHSHTSMYKFELRGEESYQGVAKIDVVQSPHVSSDLHPSGLRSVPIPTCM